MNGISLLFIGIIGISAWQFAEPGNQQWGVAQQVPSGTTAWHNQDQNQQAPINNVNEWMQYLQNSHMQQYGQYPGEQVQRQILNMPLWSVPAYNQNTTLNWWQRGRNPFHITL